MKINKNQFTVSAPLTRLRFHYHRGRGHLWPYVRNRLIWHYFPRIGLTTPFPDHVDVEISSRCNMACPMCYTRTESYRARVKRALMPMDCYRQIIDECAAHRTYSIRLSLRGEAFIHPDVVAMIAYAKGKGICEVSSLTNLLAIDDALFRELVRLGFDWLTVSFDGLGATYESIRRPARFEEAYAKIRRFRQIRQAMGRDKPVIKIQTIWPAIKADPWAFIAAFEPYADQITVNPLIDYLHNDTDVPTIPGFVCPVPWQRMVIGADGQVLQCSNDEMGKGILGDVAKDSLYAIWHGRPFRRLRRLHRRHQALATLAACKECHLPRPLVRKTVLIGGRPFHIAQYVNRSDEIGR